MEQTRSRMMCGLNSDLGNLVSWHLYQLLLFFYLLIDKVTYFFFLLNFLVVMTQAGTFYIISMYFNLDFKLK